MTPFRPFFFLGFLFLAACANTPAPPATLNNPARPTAASPVAAPTPPPAAQVRPTATATAPARGPGHSAGPTRSPVCKRASVSGISLRIVSFDSRTHRIRIADQPGGPGSKWPDSRAAGRALGGLAAINGGFFTPEGRPLGLVVAGGRRSGAWNRASWTGSGCFVKRTDALPALARREKIDPSAPGIATLLQSGPILVENGHAVGGLDAASSRPRSFLAWDGRSRWIFGVASACSLDALARALAGASPAGWPVRHALNLDGGRSSELWVSENLPGGPVFQRPFFNKPVRNFLVLAPAK